MKNGNAFHVFHNIKFRYSKFWLGVFLIIAVLGLTVPQILLRLFDHDYSAFINGSLDSGISSWAIPMMLILTFAEFIAGLIEHNPQNKGEFLLNLGLGLAVAFCNTFIRTGQVFLYFQFWQLAAVKVPFVWWSWLLCFFICDLVFYWFHRMGHEVNIFWAAHFTHHTSKEFNLSVGIRNNIIHVFYRYIFWAPICLLGFHPIMVITCDSLSAVYQYFLHTKKVKSMGVFENFLCTPSSHRVHHGCNEIYIDKNYGGCFIIWDRLFGTYVKETEPVIYGLKEGLEKYKPVDLITFKWKSIFKNIRNDNFLKVLFNKPTSN
jgi:sterol desaturase/sphingolipid hydroxylase (fatty acid hydroxylase superfamily)